VLGVLEATDRIPDGAQVAVDGVAGIVRWMA
jgi:phosphohistidine swiveling domain-containing protein